MLDRKRVVLVREKFHIFSDENGSMIFENILFSLFLAVHLQIFLLNLALLAIELVILRSHLR